MAVVNKLCQNFVDLGRMLGVCFEQIALEEELETDEMLAKEVDVVQDPAVIKGMSGLVASSAPATGVKVLIRCQSIETTVTQPFKMVET